jgi:hypothetical protein
LEEINKDSGQICESEIGPSLLAVLSKGDYLSLGKPEPALPFALLAKPKAAGSRVIFL